MHACFFKSRCDVDIVDILLAKSLQEQEERAIREEEELAQVLLLSTTELTMTVPVPEAAVSEEIIEVCLAIGCQLTSSSFTGSLPYFPLLF